MSHVPLNDLRRLSEPLKQKIAQAAIEVAASGNYILGPKVEAFQTKLADYIGVAHVLAVANGTDALSIAFLAVGAGPGDVVLTVGNAGAYSTVAARNIGAEVQLVDVNDDSFIMTPDTLKAALEQADAAGVIAKALVITHLYGWLNPHTATLVEMARERGIAVVEDCAQAIGARNGGNLAGSFGDISTFSFYPTKNLGASGDAGAVATNQEELINRAQQISQYGWHKKYEIEIAGGMNSRMDEIQAAILSVKLELLDQQNEIRRGIFRRYQESLTNETKMLVDSVDEDNIAHLAILRIAPEKRVRAQQILEDFGVSTGIHYPVADHRHPANLVHQKLGLVPQTEKAVESILTLPMFPEMTEDEISLVCSALRNLKEL